LKGGEDLQRTELKLLRVKHGFSQDKMAVRLGYSRNHYASIENGKVEPTLKFISALSNAFGLSLDEAKELTKRDEEGQA
jgi:transcriptional regulator with XRE-family HTH domain